MPRPFFKILERPEVHETGGLYVVVGFWWTKARHDAGRPPDHINDFVMLNIAPTMDRIKRRADGWLEDVDGNYHEPASLVPDPADTGPPPAHPEWKYETVSRDLIADIRRNIRDYTKRWWRKRGTARRDARLPTRPRPRADDPRGIRTAAVRSLKDDAQETDV